MTVARDPPPAKPIRAPRAGEPVAKGSHRWRLQEAEARCHELVRRVRSDGPRHVTVHDRDAVAVISAAAYARLSGGATGAVLIAALRASPHRDVDLGAAAVRSPVRAVRM